MMRNFQRGAGSLDGLLILAFLIFVLLITPKEGEESSEWWNLGGQNTPLGNSQDVYQNNASLSRGISVSSGNASYSYQPYEEYIVIENWGESSVDITGWKLKNGMDKRSYSTNQGLQRYSAGVSVIPQATLKLASKGESLNQNVILAPGERAYITTGLIGVKTPYKITSFKENICTGYIEKLSDYAFNPSLKNSCPRPSEEPGLKNMDTKCRDLVEGFSSCNTPKFESKDSNGESCQNCLNGEEVPSSCVSYIKEHFSYEGCLKYHSTDPEFSSDGNWRIFLGRSWEMWATDYETIELFDLFGNLVSSENY